MVFLAFLPFTFSTKLGRVVTRANFNCIACVKGPFRTKTATAVAAVAFRYCRSFFFAFQTKDQPEVSCIKAFLRPPRVMDVRAFSSRTSAKKKKKTLFSYAPSHWGESFWAGTSAQTSARTTAGYPARNLMFRLLFRS